MTREEKQQLLLRDLCARLDYGVKTEYFFDEGCGTHRKEVGTLKGFYPKTTSIDGVDFILEINTPTGYTYYLHYESWAIKPYLRPMSSMTEEEKEIYSKLEINIKNSEGTLFTANCNLLQRFFASHHLDNNHLIESGLALKAPEGMYEISK